MNQHHPFHLSDEDTANVSGGYTPPFQNPNNPSIVTFAYNEDGYPNWPVQDDTIGFGG